MSRQGRYLPLFAAEIYDQNTKIEALGMDPVNLSSIMIGKHAELLRRISYELTTPSQLLGNGCTDQSTMIPSYYDMECTGVTVDPVLDIGYVFNGAQYDCTSPTPAHVSRLSVRYEILTVTLGEIAVTQRPVAATL